MDKNKNKNKTNVLRSSRIIKIKATGVNTNSNYASSITSLSNSQQENVNLPLQKLSTLLNLQDSDLQILSNILRTTATSIDGLKIVLDQQLLRVLTDPNINKWIIGDMLSNSLSSDIKKIKERLISRTSSATRNEMVVLKKLNDELSKPLASVEIIEINRNLVLIVYYYSK
jgi:hypothetical protein